MKHSLPIFGTGAALLLALAPMPYGYYQLLRIAVTVCALWLLFFAQDWNDHPKWARATLITIAVLFNPLLPIHLNRELWTIIDPITAGVLVFIGIKS